MAPNLKTPQVRTGEWVALGIYAGSVSLATISTYFHDGHVPSYMLAIWLTVVATAYRPIMSLFRG